MDAGLSPAVVDESGADLIVSAGKIFEVARFLKDYPDLQLGYLTSMMGVDYRTYYEVAYFFFSIIHNHRLTVRVRLEKTENPALPSITPLFMGANFQEREIFDLLGISFTDHPNLKRIFLWEGFEGHPLRKDFASGS